MSTRKGAMEDPEKFLTKEREEGFLRFDHRNERVFFEGEWMDVEGNQETLRQVLDDKRQEMNDLKSSFLREFQDSVIDDKKTENIARKLGRLSTDINDLEELLE